MAQTISRRNFLKGSVVAGATLGLSFYDSKKVGVNNQFDTIISNGVIYTGDGGKPVTGSVGIKDGKIAAIGNIGDSADQIIDAKGMAVTPGFIDIHSHTDGNIRYAQLGDSKIYQGITTDVSGNCGESVFPQSEWKSISDYNEEIERMKIGINIRSYIGQGTLRHIVVGDNDVRATKDDIKKMKYLLEEELEKGAIGVTCGLEYTPGSYASNAEIVELLKVAAKHDKTFAIHMRNEDDMVEEALAETIDMARKANVRLQVSHLKAQNAANWHKAPKLIKQIEDARNSGMDIAFDRYSYNAFSTGMSIFIPLKHRQGTTEEIIARMNDKVQGKEIETYVNTRLEKLGGAKNVMVTSAKTPENRKFIGYNVEECAKMTNLSNWEFMKKILIEENLIVDIVGFSMNEDNLKMFLSHPLGMPITDCSVYSPVGKLAENMPHPRAYGSFTRFVGKYCRDEKLMDLSAAVRKCTSLPASRIGLKNRGLIQVGYMADLLVFNPDTIIDRATYAEPHQYSTGIEHILVNGVWTIANGMPTGEFGGRAS